MPETKEKESYLFRFLDHRDHLVDAKTERCLDDADANTRALESCATSSCGIFRNS